MTNEQIVAVLKKLRDETETDGYSGHWLRCTPEQIAALNSAIAHSTALKAATGEEGKAHVDMLTSYAESTVCAAAITALAASEARVKTLTGALRSMSDAAEMLWIVLANVSGGDWEKQSSEWQGAAARWRDNYFAALKEAGHE